ncbi:MAG: GHKL domain-containing protein [Eubacterium sp.]|jgi:Signal transduction histidine kinase regulating citrate/malate metabolism|nr:GHKL domain-containing protein [Eubacterium sp.]
MMYVSVAGAVVLELLCSVFLLNGLLGREEKIPRLWAILFVAVASVYILTVPDSWINGCYLITVLYVRLGYRVSWKDSLVTTVLSLVLGGVVELVCFFPFVFLLRPDWPDIITNLAAAFFSAVLCYVMAGRIPVWYLKKWCTRKEVWYIILLLFSLMVMLTAVVNFQMTLELDLGDYIYVTICLVFLWFLVFRLMKYRYEERIRKKYFDAFRSVIDQIKRRQHKFRNQLDAVYSLHIVYDDYDTLVEEQRKYLGKLADYEMPADVLILESPILIAHVYEKITEAQEAGLRIRMKLKCSLADCGIEDIHMVELLGTLLDNAIQDMAASGQTEYLVFEVEKQDGIMIRVANPHSPIKNQELQRMFQKGYSTKGEDRGIGLYHVKKLVQKYKIGLMAENKMIGGKNYICFSLMTGKNTPLV